MPLLAPRVIGPVSECSSSIHVQGQITGATVNLYTTGHAAPIGTGVASWSDQYFALNAGVTLTPGHTVYATQTQAAQTSPHGPGITVQKKPAVIGPVAFQSHLYHCARCVWLIGAVPGAQVDLTVAGNPDGSTISADGNARIGLTRQLGPADILVARQTACGTLGPAVNGPKPDPVPIDPNRRVPPPTLPGPLTECDSAVLVTNVFEGATVTLTRSAAPPESACFGATGLWFLLNTPLALHETVTAQQDFPKCELKGIPTPALTAGPVAPVPPPVVKEPLCAGQTSVTLTDYQPGALIEIFQSAVSLGIGQAPETASFDFPTPPLVAGDIITARQTLCGKTSVDSNAVPVDPSPKGMPTPVVPPPLFECGSVVRVENLHIGARVYVFSTMLGAEIGDTQAFASTVDVPVAPLLIKGDHIFARQIGCGKTSHDSGPRLVQAFPKMLPPQVGAPLDDCMSAVPVTHVVPGALVDVDVNGIPRGSAAAGGTSVSVPISGRLHVGDVVTARQRLCTQITAFSERAGRVVPSHARDWPMYHHDPQHTGLVACSDITRSNAATLHPPYKPIPLQGTIASVPAIVAGKIYVGTGVDQGGKAYLNRIDLATGHVEGSYQFTPTGQADQATGIACTPAVVAGKVYFSVLDGTIRCIDAASLALLWSTDLKHPDPAHNQPVSNPVAETWSSPVVVNNRVYVGAGEGELGAFGFVYCLDANTGSVVWLFCTNQFVSGTPNLPNAVPSSSVGGHVPAGYVGFSVSPDPPSKGASVWSSCAYHAGLNRIYFGTGNPYPDSPLPNAPYSSGIVALDATSGTLQGFFQPLTSDNYRPDDSDIDVPAPPTVYSLPGQDVVAISTKSAATFLLNPNTMAVLARRQLLPKDGAGNPLPTVDVRPPGGENSSGVFGCAAIDPVYGHLYFGLGGYNGLDAPTTPFLRACDWTTLDDEWPTVVGADTVTRYSTANPPMYQTSQPGLSSPAVVNAVVFVATGAPALYAFSSANGIPLWTAPGFPGGGSCLGPAISGNYIVAGAGNKLMVYTL